MSELGLDDGVIRLVSKNARRLEKSLKADVILYSGIIIPPFVRDFRNFIESVRANSKQTSIAIVLNTGGGSVEAVERYVDIVRHHYQDVSFIVPDAAMSAGTVWCMSGDRVYMDYASALGPIDPQVPDSAGIVLIPAQGYLDKVKELSEKKSLSEADTIMLHGIDLAKLSLYEQAKELSLDLLKLWLVKYKFKNWTVHGSNSEKKGEAVTEQEKEERAQKIAEMLSDNARWHAHGRYIGIQRLQVLRLKIEDYSNDSVLRAAVRAYHDTLVVYARRMDRLLTLHHRLIGIKGVNL